MLTLYYARIGKINRASCCLEFFRAVQNAPFLVCCGPADLFSWKQAVEPSQLAFLAGFFQPKHGSNRLAGGLAELSQN